MSVGIFYISTSASSQWWQSNPFFTYSITFIEKLIEKENNISNMGLRRVILLAEWPLSVFFTFWFIIFISDLFVC